MGPMWWAHPCEDQKVSLIVEDEFYSKLHLETPSLGCGTKQVKLFSTILFSTAGKTTP